MFIKNLMECEEIIAGDGCFLREILHPDKMDVNLRYSLAHAKVMVGQKTKPHRLNKSEVYYIINGKGLMHIDSNSFEVLPNSTIYIPPNAIQYIENIGNSELFFLCIVDPAWNIEDEEII